MQINSKKIWTLVAIIFSWFVFSVAQAESNVAFGLGGVHSSLFTYNDDLGEKFAVSSNKSSDSIALYIASGSNAVDPLGIQVCHWVSSSNPCGSVISSAFVPRSDIGSSSTRVYAKFDQTINFDTGSNYFVRFFLPSSGINGNYNYQTISSATTTGLVSFTNEYHDGGGWHTDLSPGAFTGFELFQSPHSYGPFQAQTAHIFSPAPFDLIRDSDLSSGLEVGAYMDINSGSTTNLISFNLNLIHGTDLISSATGVVSNYVYAGKYAVLNSFSSSLADFPAGTYTILAQACQDGLCGGIGSENVNVLKTIVSTATNTAITGTEQPLGSLSGTFPKFECGVTLTDLCVGYTLGTWIPDVVKWFVIPPSVSSFNPSSLFVLFKSRWPFAYFFGPIDSWQTGYNAGASCPLPTFMGGVVMFGRTAPTFDLCPILAAAGAAIESNSFGKTTLQWVIYLSAAYAAWEVLIHTVHRKK